jgi:transglutaminase-like putative cysteine protease
MADFSFSLDSDVGRFAATGSVEGDTLLQVEVDAGGRLQRVTHRLARPPVFAAALPIRLAAGEGLEVGSRVRFPVFDPSTISTRNVEVRVTAHDTLVVPDSAALDQETGRWMPAHYDSVPAWQIAEAFGGIQVESWVDEDGRIVRATSPLGFSMERTEYELARQAQEDARGLPGSPVDEDVVLSTAIQSDVNLEAVEGYRELRFRLSGVDLAGFELEGGRQSLRGDTLTVRQEVWAALDPGFELPYPRMDLRDYLSPEPLIQSDDERIIDAAERVTHRWPFQRQDPLRVAQHLTVAVNQRLEKSITISVPSAVQVLESGTGDCNEHTVLYVAMARALGLPARTAVGLVYLNGAFFYHAWPEVWLGQWVAVDPTFGQYPADAAHLRFVVGGLAQQIEILRLIGRLEIEVIPPHGQVQEEG